nr:response regulator [Planctomycetota bacterium]
MKTMSIFHIDDNAGDLTLAQEAFASQAGISYHGSREPIAAIGKLGMDSAAGRLPSLILLDLNLSGMDGYDVLKLLAANRELSRIPVVVLTSSDDERERETCLKLGAVSFMTKPNTFDGLCATLAAVVTDISRRRPAAMRKVAAGDDASTAAASGRVA